MSVNYGAGTRSPLSGEALFEDPSPELLEALMIAITNRLRFPVPGMPNGALISNIDVNNQWADELGGGHVRIATQVRISFIA